jgi:hypothetical protein
VRSKLGFAEVFEHNHEEVAALYSFVNLKERQLDRHIKLHASQGQRQAYQSVIVETRSSLSICRASPTLIKLLFMRQQSFGGASLKGQRRMREDHRFK